MMFELTQRRIAGLGAALCLAACASTPPPQLELERARNAITAAERVGAAELAPVDYRMAGEALDQGRALIEQRENAAAKWRLELAQARAELAASKAEGARLRGQVQAKEADNLRLRRELLGEDAR
jgi:hypothetical protein